MIVNLERSSPVQRTSRVMQLEGMFDLSPSETSSVRWEAHLPIEDQPWNIGLIVGPSGAGKSTLIREIWPDRYASSAAARP